MRRAKISPALYVPTMRGRVLATLVAFGALTAPAQADVDVTVNNGVFTPKTITITEGEVVTWTWVGSDTAHSVTSRAQNDQRASFDSHPGIDNPTGPPPGGKFSHEFEFDGTYEYFDKRNPGNVGTIVVRNRVRTTPPPPDESGPRFSATRVSVRKRRVTFKLNEPARVTAKLRGPMKRTLRLKGKAGRNTLKLPKKLKPGRYSLSISATDEADNTSRRVVKRFRVRKKK